MNSLLSTQLLAVIRLEWRKTFFARRGLWIYLLAFAPVALFTVGSIVERQFHGVRQEPAAAEPLLTSEQLNGIHVDMTRPEIIEKLGQPRSSSLRDRRKFTENGEGIRVREEILRYSSRDRDLTLVLDEGKVVGTISKSRLTFGQKNYVFAGVFQFFFIRLAVFFGCLGIFMNLFRGEMLDKSLHYYLLAPLRRDVLLAGKYLAGVLAATVIFTSSTALQILASFAAYDSATVARYVYQEHGLSHIIAYLGVTILACIGYGSVFLAAGLLFRNPMIPAALVLIWEAANPLLPALLKKFSVIYYLKSLCPVQIPLDPSMPPLFAMLVSTGDPISAYIAVFGLLALSVFVLWASSVKVRRIEINYTTE